MDESTPKGPMNPEAQEIFDRLVRLQPNALTVDERAFLRARRDYMSDGERKSFKGVLNERVVVDEEESPVSEVKEEAAVQEVPSEDVESTEKK